MKTASRYHQAGVGLVEVMIALLLSLFTIGVIIQVFLGNHRTFLITEAVARVQEESRFALNLLQKELRLAGYLGCISKQGVTITSTLSATTTPYDFRIRIRGYDNLGSTLPTAISGLFGAGEPKPRSGSDLLLIQSPVGNGVPVIRNNSAAQLFAQLLSTKANYCAPNKPAYSDFCEGDIVMVSDCQKARVFQITNVQAAGGELNINHSNSNSYVPGNTVSSWGGNSAPAEERFGPGSLLHRLETRLYYIARPAADRPWTLYRKNGSAAGTPVVDGIADLQLTYGEDRNRDRAADTYVTAGSVSNWDNVMSVGIALLLRSGQGGVLSSPQSVSFAGGTFQSADSHWYWATETTVALRNRVP